MKYNQYTGKFFLIRSLFLDPAVEKIQSALAISEPDQKGDIEFLLVTADRNNRQGMTVDVPGGLLEKDGMMVCCDKQFFLHNSLILGLLAEIDRELLKQILKKVVESNVGRYFQAAHQPELNKAFVPGTSRINYAGRVYDQNELNCLVDSALDFWLTAGKYAQRFEKEFARLVGVRYCSLVNSGSSANLLAVMALTSPKLGERRIRAGDEIITAAAGFPTTVAPILQAGGIPVFVDVRLPDANVEPEMLECALSKKTKAVILAHTLGFPFDGKRIRDFCNQHGLWLIEDNCDALGSRFRIDGQWYNTGTVGHMGTSSFYPPHHITMGEGGAVYTNYLELKRVVESLRDWGRDCWCPSGHDDSCKKRFKQQFGSLPFGYDHKYVYSHFGYNLKATDMQAAIGCAQLEKLERFTGMRQANHKRIYEGLKDLSRIFHLPKIMPDTVPSPFGFLLILKDGSGFTRNDITSNLASRHIQTRNLFAGNITRHPCFDHLEQGKDYRIAGDLKITDKIMQDAFWVGVYPGMSEQMLDYMIQSIREFVKSGDGAGRCR